MHPLLLSTFSQYETLILVGGGTGGHIQPILNIIMEVQGTKNLLWIGGKNSEEQKVAEENTISFESIPTLKLTTTKSPKILLYPLVLLRGIWEARRCLKIYRKKHACIFSKGGPGSIAIGIAGWTLGIPIYIHESDTIPGRSNHILGKIATKIFLGFESTKRYFDATKCEIVGQILHPIFSARKPNSPITAYSISWKTLKPHILVICGSQGAKVVFESIIEQFSGNEKYEWIIALGKLNTGLKKDLEKIPYARAFEWISQEDIAHLCEDADIAITRGSATTLAEIDTFGIKKIIIPLPHSAKNHQYWNAKWYEQNCGDILLEEKDMKNMGEIISNYYQYKKRVFPS